MVSIVIVSHSKQLAAGVVELAGQMVQGQVALAAAGGSDNPDNPIGTDAMQILAAIDSVYSEDGVVVLMDLGSAILSTEMAVEFLPVEQRANVHLCAAPLVEGAIAAVVQAAAGGPVTAVIREAMTALLPKHSQLGMVDEDQSPITGHSPLITGQSLRVDLPIRNKLGLHARPAARFVSTAVQFQSEITVQKGTLTASAKSMNQVATLGARQGETVTVTAVGPDAAAAITALQALAADNFGDKDEDVAAATAVTPASGGLGGIAASPGIAIGPAFHYRLAPPPVTAYQIEDVAAEWRWLDTAVAAALLEIQELYAAARQQMGVSEADIFQAHQLMLQDPALHQDVRQRITRQHINAAAAWQQAIDAVAAAYEAIPDAVMRARAADMRDVGQRVLRHLTGVARPSLTFPEPVVLLAAELTPSDTAQLDPAQVLGIVTARGGATSHSAILARGLGIPAVVGAGDWVVQVKEGQMVALDGRTGQLWLKPNKSTLAGLQRQRDTWLQERQAVRAAAQEPAQTADGRRLEIGANIGAPQETAVAVQFGAEGVGLFRTEFLFLDRKAAPDEEEQVAAYVAAATGLAGRPLIIRTLDVGGDKPLPYLDLGREENPFLGWRGIRFCLETPHIFRPQLRAILRASHGHNIKLMFPMVSTLTEVRAAKTILAEVQAELQQAHIPYAADMEVGIMIEVPAAVAIADQLAREVDFFSIGTNDLTQYVMAADRGNARVAALANALHPAVLRLVKQTVQAGHAAGIWVGMCGELAGNALAAPLLVGLGLDELSMAAPAIAAVKTAVRGVTVAEAEELAGRVLELDSGTAVMELLGGKG
ncbi:MAG: phosphoenolpyruvate--protein phosphotransferase [Chloroflexi bacterium]|nr:phosphoenolpyruvate--protein phosphotransferase [Ardenticatenaceae bacterium]MBL1127116.1 phosphoenolpyruvate--protein phosphotransferase [Chloroflexota bacterium]NOG33175.1 phosphoenolpyruvate--protein phosphotransferase [Chloroflexota bacterium]GIK54971.1 MAG: multiphosphoryl transfer protein [Chloroflexota bacterium]